MAEQILIIDDEIKTFGKALEEILDAYELSFADLGTKGLDIVRKKRISLVLLDMKMPSAFGKDPQKEGIAVLKEIKKLRPELPVVMLTVSSDVELVVEAVKEGAFYYLLKPPDRSKLISVIEKALENSRLKDELTHLKNVVKVRDEVDSFKGTKGMRRSFGCIIGQSEAMQAVYRKIEKVSPIAAPILVKGPTGSGKELVASEIHALSGRKGPFVPINCSAIPDALLETELFGYEKGAFTGADSSRKGKFEYAHKGTLFLDEIGDMPLLLQAKLLRVLQDHTVAPLGKNEPVRVDVRVISATNRNIEEMMKEGKFREDLYYRLNVISIEMPPLADRPEDILLLVEHFVKKYAKEYGKKAVRPEPELIERLTGHPWPGNVRELESVVQKLIAMSETEVLTASGLRLEEAQPCRVQEPGTADELWDAILRKSVKIEDLTDFRNTHGSRVLEEIVSRAIEKARDLKEAGIIIGYIPEDDQGEKYANFRQWVSRLGLSKKRILAKKG